MVTGQRRLPVIGKHLAQHGLHKAHKARAVFGIGIAPHLFHHIVRHIAKAAGRVGAEIGAHGRRGLGLPGKGLARQRIAVCGHGLRLQGLVGIAHGHFCRHGAHHIVEDGDSVHLARGLVINQKRLFPGVVLRQQALEQAQGAAAGLCGGLRRERGRRAALGAARRKGTPQQKTCQRHQPNQGGKQQKGQDNAFHIHSSIFGSFAAAMVVSARYILYNIVNRPYGAAR